MATFPTTFAIILLITVCECRNLPRYVELDEDEQMLYRAAYETPSYDSEQYEEHEDQSTTKLELLKDAVWAIKAKVMELKMFNKALAANLLSTKLKLKELIASGLLLKKHMPVEVPEKKKPSYNYQAPSHATYEPYAPSHYAQDPYHGH